MRQHLHHGERAGVVFGVEHKQAPELVVRGAIKFGLLTGRRMGEQHLVHDRRDLAMQFGQGFRHQRQTIPQQRREGGDGIRRDRGQTESTGTRLSKGLYQCRRVRRPGSADCLGR